MAPNPLAVWLKAHGIVPICEETWETDALYHRAAWLMFAHIVELEAASKDLATNADWYVRCLEDIQDGRTVDPAILTKTKLDYTDTLHQLRVILDC